MYKRQADTVEAAQTAGTDAAVDVSAAEQADPAMAEQTTDGQASAEQTADENMTAENQADNGQAGDGQTADPNAATETSDKPSAETSTATDMAAADTDATENSGTDVYKRQVNTLYIVVLTLLIATPIGIGSAIYLNEYAKGGKLVRLIEFTTETLSGIPSIIFGLFGICLLYTSEYRDIAHPINSETRDHMQKVILKAYEKSLSEPEME